jgi:D-aspartate ligase
VIRSPDINRTVPVLIFKARRYVFHHGALGIARNLSEIGVPVYAIVENRFTPLALSRYLTDTFVLETEGLDSCRLLEAMATIGEKLKQPTIVISTDDTAACFIAEHATELSRWFLFPSLKPDLPRNLADKTSLYDLCHKLAVPCPDSSLPTSLDDVNAFINGATFPVVAKTPSTGSQSSILATMLIKTAEELLALYQRAQAARITNILFQEYIPGEDWIFHGYTNAKTNYFLPFTGRKLRSYPPGMGFTTLGVSVANNELVLQAQSFLSAIAYSGIMDMDYRLDMRDRKYKLVDFNPRVGANFRMFDDVDGMNVARALHFDLTGKSMKNSPMVEGRVFVVEPYDFLACVKLFRQGKLTTRTLWPSSIGAREFAWFKWNDPLPFFSTCLGIAFEISERALKRLRARVSHLLNGRVLPKKNS